MAGAGGGVGRLLVPGGTKWNTGARLPAGRNGPKQPLTYRRGAFLPEGASKVKHKERSDESETEPEGPKQEGGRHGAGGDALESTL